MADWPWPLCWDPSASHFVANETFSRLAPGDFSTVVVHSLPPGPRTGATSDFLASPGHRILEF